MAWDTEGDGVRPANEDADIRREKAKARELRASAWWKRRLAAGRCGYCDRPTPPRELTMDHRVPLVRGGRSTRGNVVAACKACNNAKKYLVPVEWDATSRGSRRPKRLDNPAGPDVGLDKSIGQPGGPIPAVEPGGTGSSRGPAVGGRFSVAGAWARVVRAPRKEVVQPCVQPR